VDKDEVRVRTIQETSPDLKLTVDESFILLIILSMEQIARLASIKPGPVDPEAAGLLTALAYPDRIARRQEDGSYRLTSGRKGVWPGPSTLSDHEFLAVAQLDGSADNARIWQAAPLSWQELHKHFGDLMRFEDEVRFDPLLDRVVSRRKLMLDALCLRDEPLAADRDAVTRALLAGLKDISRLPWDDQRRALRAEFAFCAASTTRPGPTCPTPLSSPP
jgi:ATP-dependent helicase HrpB